MRLVVRHVRHKLVLLGAVTVIGVSFGFLVLDFWLTRRWLTEDEIGRAHV